MLKIIAPTAPVRHEVVQAPVSPELSPAYEIPRSEFVRIRTWLKYGMTASEVAEVCGVAASEIERVLRKA